MIFLRQRQQRRDGLDRVSCCVSGEDQVFQSDSLTHSDVVGITESCSQTLDYDAVTREGQSLIGDDWGHTDSDVHSGVVG